MLFGFNYFGEFSYVCLFLQRLSVPFPLEMPNYVLAKNMKTDGIKRKGATSLESINAVERELDEVLKDLEMNSQDLNLSFRDLQQKSQKSNPIELPIRFANQQQQQQIKPSSLTSSSFLAVNNINTNVSNRTSTTSNSSTSTIQNTTTNENDLQKKRKNILSTYEFCDDCCDSKSESTTKTVDNLPYGQQHSAMPLKITLHSSSYTDSQKPINGVCLPIRTSSNNNNNNNNNKISELLR